MNRITELTLLILLLSNPVFAQGITIKKQEIFQTPNGDSRFFTYSPHAKAIMTIDGDEYLPIVGYYNYATNRHYDTGLLKRIDNKWELIDVDETQMLGARSHSFIDSSTMLLSEAYEEFPDYHDWGGYIYELHIESDKLQIRQLHPQYGYYHYVASGDLNNDGRYDMMSHQWLFLQNADNSFRLKIPFYLRNRWADEISQFADSTFDFIHWGAMERMNGPTHATGIFDLYAGGMPEIIQGQIDVGPDPTREYDPLSPDQRGQVYILEYDNSNNRYEVVYEIPRVHPREYRSAPETFNVADVNLDGINDLIIETSNCYRCDNPVAAADGRMPQGIEVWLGTADKTFHFNQAFLSEGPVLGVFMFDVNGDTYPDIVLQGSSSSEGFVRNWCTGETNPSCDEMRQNGLATRDGFYLHEAMHINNGAGFFDLPEVQMEIPRVSPESWLMPHVRDGNLVYHGFEYWYDAQRGLVQMIVEIEIDSNYFTSAIHKPTVVATQSSRSCEAPCIIEFDASGSLDPDGDTLTFEWDFGDGITSSEPMEGHLFRTPGERLVRVTASDGMLTGSFEMPVIIASQNPPNASITASMLNGRAPVTIDFHARASSDMDGDPLTYAWDFGDDILETGETVSHTYTAAGEYTVVLTASDGVLTGTDSLTVSIASGVDTESFELPESFVLKAAYPNPFNPTTTVTYGLPAAAEVRITATDLLGRQVATLVAGDMKAAGYHTVQFNADGLASGAYLIRMEAGDFVATQQVVLLK